MGTELARKPYRPHNGMEGLIFQGSFCDRCRRDDFNEATGEGGCPILANSFAFQIHEPGYPKEWQFDASGEPTCTAFEGAARV